MSANKIVIQYAKTTLTLGIVNKIGGGGEGEVYQAIDPQLNKEIAVKIINASKFNNFDEYFDESRKLYLSNHHNVVEVSFATNDGTNVYIGMPYYKNGSLKNLIDAKSFKVSEIVRYSLQFLSGLNNIHSKKLIHFDIKPENILINDSNQAEVADFGVAKYVDIYGLAQSATTHINIPPEYLSQPVQTFRFDIYQAGLVMYRMCVGNTEFFNQIKKFDPNYHLNLPKLAGPIFEKIKKGKFPDRTVYPLHIPASLKKIINKCLNVDADLRYSNVLDVLNDLSKVIIHDDWQPNPNNPLNDFEWVGDNKSVQINYKNGEYEIISKTKRNKKSELCGKFSKESEFKRLVKRVLTKKW